MFFPENSVEYFVSFYDYYQPEAYIPQRDIYIEKDASKNDELDRLRLAATTSLTSRDDVIIVASVSCIFGLGSPEGQKELEDVVVHRSDELSNVQVSEGGPPIGGRRGCLLRTGHKYLQTYVARICRKVGS